MTSNIHARVVICTKCKKPYKKNKKGGRDEEFVCPSCKKSEAT